MIRLPPTTPPPLLSSERAHAARRLAAEFFGRAPKEREQKRFRFDDRLLTAAEIREALWQLTSGKCAYCESPLAVASPLDIDHFRPSMGAVDLDGSFSVDHYWWLAYEWDNLLPACAECSRFKGTRFPVGAKRAPPPAAGDELDAEQPLLLDPRRDQPQEHLVFVESGEAVSKSERGRVTIEVLGLNRRHLLLARAAEITRAYAEWLVYREQRGPAVAHDIVAAGRPYAALRRQFFATWMNEAGLSQAERPQLADAEASAVSKGERRVLKSDYTKRKVAQDAYSVEDTAVSEDYFISARLVERVVIENVRVIKDLDLDVSTSTAQRTPWLMLLGENGTGKSSILQVVALALAGDAYRERLPVSPANYVRRGARRGIVDVHLTGGSEPIRLTITRSSFTSSHAEPKVLLLGYGATRLLPRPGLPAMKLTSDSARVENLFDPFSPLGDATAWLLDLPAAAFHTAARALKGILALDEDAVFYRNRRARRIDVEAFGERVPLEHLSDGYQSVLGLTVDVMSVMFHRWPAMDVAEGVVVIDELGAHLHPRWRMRIVTSLRAVFPRVQFLASTHDPLCLRGLADGEVAVLQRHPDGGVFAVEELPPVEGLRVDQLLTSEVFGLNTTIDPELDALFTRYYELKGKAKPTAAEKNEIADLHSRLDSFEVLGQTARERLMLEAADDFLAQQRRLADGGQRRELRATTKRRIAELWADTEPLKPPAR